MDNFGSSSTCASDLHHKTDSHFTLNPQWGMVDRLP
jgi:hypothetical protein